MVIGAMQRFLPRFSILSSLCLVISGGQLPATSFDEVQPLLKQFCYDCHNPDKKEGHLDLASLHTEAALLQEHETLDHLQWVISEKEMPPMKSEQHPSEEQRAAMVDYIEESLMRLTNAQPFDPGIVPMPHLTQDEFDYIVEDLTGFDLNLGQYLTADTASEEGFHHFGARQTMSVGQFEGFLSTFKKLLGYSRIVPKAGLTWSSIPMEEAESEAGVREKVLEGWKEWHERQVRSQASNHVDELEDKIGSGFTAYLEAAWQYQHRAAFGAPNATFEQIAQAYEVPLVPSSVELTWRMVAKPETVPGFDKMMKNPFWHEIQRQWHALPAPRNQDTNSARKEIAAITKWRTRAVDDNNYKGYSRHNELMIKPKDSGVGQQIRGTYERGDAELRIDLTQATDDTIYFAAGPIPTSQWHPEIVLHSGLLTLSDGSKKPWQEVTDHLEAPNGQSVPLSPDGTITMPTPNHLAFAVPKGATQLVVHGRYGEAKGQGPAAVRLQVLNDAPQDYFESIASAQWLGAKKPEYSHRLDRLANAVRGLDSASPASVRMNNNTDFAGLPNDVLNHFGIKPPSSEWRDDPGLLAFTAKEIRQRADDTEKQNLESLRTQILSLAGASGMDEAALEAEARQVIGSLLPRLWRRIPTHAEVEGLMNLYRTDRADGRAYDVSVKTALTAALMSPDFLYRPTTSSGQEEPYLLHDLELATRLAFVLWGRLPDGELLQLAANDQLANAQNFNAQVDRMLADPRAEAFIEQFAGLWLGFNDFDRFEGPDAEKYNNFDQPLREAMYQEVKRFFETLVRENRPITEVFTADYTYLNERLAGHYGVPGVEGPEMRRVSLHDTSQRGGILGMGAFLTKTSEPLRTSPVHRGIWVYEDILGLPIPAPPANVPTLSDEETNEEGLTVAQQLAQHREDPACSSCHDRFDPLGVALENYDPIGAWRTRTGGQPVDARGEFADGQVVEGLPQLRAMMVERQDIFLHNFCEKLLAYTLGRSLLPTDKPTIEAMIAALAQNEFRFQAALDVALLSPQFLKRRDSETLTAAHPDTP